MFENKYNDVLRLSLVTRTTKAQSSGMVRATSLRSEAVECTAVALLIPEAPCLGFGCQMQKGIEFRGEVGFYGMYVW